MVGLFVGYGLEWAASSLLPRSTTTGQVRSCLQLYRLSLPISGPGLLILILSGGYLASVTGGMKQAWISAAFLGILFALGVGFVFILPKMKALRAGLPEGDAPLSEAGRARVQDPMVLTLIRVRMVLALGIVYLMTGKPQTLASALFILLGSIVVGMLSAVSAWSSRSAGTKT
jgi:ABC-type transport system involved in cytochrome c biogenesis permease subunit